MWAIVFWVTFFVIEKTVFYVIGKNAGLTEKESLKRDEMSKSQQRELEEKTNLFKSAKKIFNICYFALLLTTVFLSSIYITDEQDIGFTSMFGHTTAIETAGIHFKVPFLSQKHILDGTTQSMAIGYTPDNNESDYKDSLMITSDFNFVNVDFYMEYRISDPIQYVYGSDNPEEILRNVATASIRNTVGQYSVDDVMTTGKTQIEIDIREDIIAELENHKTGLTLLNITIQDAEPPTTEVTSAFKDVENKKQEAESALNDANKYKNTQTAAAEAEAEQIKQEANAAKTERINQATEEVAKFEALYEEYLWNPDTVRTRLYLEAIEDILPSMKIIIGDDVKVVEVDGNSVVEQ